MTVLHRINAMTLPAHFGSDPPFDVVIWNHPHLGLEDFRLHRLLLAHFFSSATAVLVPETGVVCVSVVNGQDTRWNLKGQAGVWPKIVGATKGLVEAVDRPLHSASTLG